MHHHEVHHTDPACLLHPGPGGYNIESVTHNGALGALTTAQDTYHCPDGWTLEEDSSGCRCFLISGSEAVTKSDAEILCDFHDGAWVAELDHPGKYNSLMFSMRQLLEIFFFMFSSLSSLKYLKYLSSILHILGINYWLKSELLATTEVGEYGQFWLGAFTEVRSNTLL